MVTTGSLNVEETVPVIVAREIQMYTMPNLEFWARINHHEREDFDVGDTLQIPTYLTRPTVGANLGTGLDGEPAEAATVTATYNDQNTGGVNVFIQHWYHVGIELSAYAEAVSQADLQGMFKQAGLDSLAVQIDTTVGDLATGFLQIQGTLGTPLTDDLIVDGGTELDIAEVPDGNRSFVFSAEEKGNYLKIDKYINSLYRGDTAPLTRGEIGSLYGQDWAWSTNVNGSAGTHSSLMFHPDAIGGVMRREPVVKAADVEDPLLTTRIVAMSIWGVNETRDPFGVLMRGS
jgi:hypothetical protein